MNLNHEPFNTLLEIEQKCRLYAKPLPSQKALGRMWQGIGFMSNDVHYVSPIHEIKEVLQLPELTRLPSGVGWFRGVSNMRGHLLPITDLQAFMAELVETDKNLASLKILPRLSGLSRILVIDFEGGPVGFLVQQVFGIQRFPVKDFDLSIENAETKTFHDGQVTWHLLSLNTLSQMPLFNHIVKQMVA